MPLAFALFDARKGNEDTLECIMKWCIKSVTTVKGLEMLREALGGIRFVEKVHQAN